MIELDLLPDAVLRLDGNGRISEANAAATGLTGYRREELVGQRFGELLDVRTSNGTRPLADDWHPSTRLRSVRRIPEQLLVLRRAGGAEVRAFATGVYERDGDGRLVGAVLSLRRADGHARPGGTGIEIVSTVSHELRSPLTSVKGYTSLLLNRWDRLKDDQKKMMLEQVHHDADRVTRLITELLDISRLETGRLVLRRQMVDLQAVTRSVVDKLRLEYPDIEVGISYPPDLPAVYADPDKIVQVLTNLVENACKYASPRGIEVAGTVTADGVEVEVRDRGEGIPGGDLSKVFSKFFRRAETKPTGSGLGLWISRGLVRAHGGDLTASSTVGQGSTFRFTLPLNTFEELHDT